MRVLKSPERMTWRSRSPSAAVLVFVFSLLWTNRVAALEIDVLSATDLSVPVGGTFSIDLAVHNASRANVALVESRVQGAHAAGMQVASGRSSHSILVSAVGGTAVDALPSLVNSGFDPDDFTRGRQPTAEHDDVTIGIWIDVVTRSADGALDGGIDGTDVLDPRPRDATIEFLASVVGVHRLMVTRTWVGILSGEVIIRDLQPIELTVRVVPEPSAASLIGLGLLLLANRRSPNRF